MLILAVLGAENAAQPSLGIEATGDGSQRSPALAPDLVLVAIAERTAIVASHTFELLDGR